MTLMEAIDDLDSKGFAIINEVFKAEEIEDFQKKYIECEEDAHSICKTYPSSSYDYIEHFDRERVSTKRSYCENTIIEIAIGRYDARRSI